MIRYFYRTVVGFKPPLAILLLVTISLTFLMAVEYSGLVVDSITQIPLQDCIIKSSDGFEVVTNSHGQFLISLPKKELSEIGLMEINLLIVSRPNYHTQLIEITQTDQSIVISLEPVVYPFSPVHIEGKYRNPSDIGFPSGSFTLNTVQVESSISTADAINQLPGIITKSYGGPAGVSTVSLFGGQADRMAILLDGVMLNNEQNGSADISQIPHSLLENMSFYPQGSSARFGSSAITGVINLTPKHGKNFISHTAGSYNLNDDIIQLSFKKNWFSSSASAGRFRYDGLYKWKENGIEFDYFENSIDQRYYYFINKVILPDSILIKAQVLDVKNIRLLSGYIYSGRDIAQMNDRLQIVSFEIHKAPITFQWNQKLNIIDYNNPPGPGPPVSAHHRLRTSDFIISTNHHDLGYQLKIRSENSKSTNSIDTTRTIMSSIIDLDIELSKFELVFVFRSEFEKHHQSLAAGEGTLIFHQGTSWQQSSLTLSNNYKRPGFNDLYWIPFGNPNLKIERSLNISFRNKFDVHNTRLDLNVFFIKYDDLIQWTPMNNGIVWSPENIPNAESFGYNLYWTYQTNPLFRVAVSLLKNDTYYHSPGNADLESKSLRYSPKYIFSINHSTLFEGFILTTDFKFISKQVFFYDYPKDQTIPAYSLINLGLSKEFRMKYANVSYVFTIHNLQDIQYQSIHGYPEPGRSFNFKSTITRK
ncbi:MAG: TonB-dependent receptor [Candidatus Marinimicrobia bacterium]|nr:TonB-dependent receptor [Candidatus Neomarinimicrobiota bacterium]